MDIPDVNADLKCGHELALEYGVHERLRESFVFDVLARLNTVRFVYEKELVQAAAERMHSEWLAAHTGQAQGAPSIHTHVHRLAVSSFR